MIEWTNKYKKRLNEFLQMFLQASFFFSCDHQFRLVGRSWTY